MKNLKSIQAQLNLVAKLVYRNSLVAGSESLVNLRMAQVAEALLIMVPPGVAALYIVLTWAPRSNPDEEYCTQDWRGSM